MITLQALVARLRRYYGKPAAPASRDPFRLVLHEQVAYLVPDARRREAFAALQSDVGLAPADILGASVATLRRVARQGGAIGVTVRASRMRASAEEVLGRWRGNLRAALKLPVAEARRALARFAMIGEPGADRILVIARKARLLPLDSNGLRVLQRVGLIDEARNYRTTYRRAQEALAKSLPRTHDGMVAAGALLRLHGQTICKRNLPECPRCPLKQDCAYYARTVA